MTEDYVNDWSTTLNGAINNAVTALTATATPPAALTPNFRIRIDDEIMLVTSIGGGTNWTVVREAEEATRFPAAAHANGAAITHVLTAASLPQIIDERIAGFTTPGIPTALSATAGAEMMGLRWAQSHNADLRLYEVRFAPESSPGSGTPDTGQWVSFDADATNATVMGLTADVLYFAQVRAVDRLDRVWTSAGDPTPVDRVADPEAGWSNITPDWETAMPTLVTAADVDFNSVTMAILATNMIDATTIQTGTLSFGAASMVSGLLIYNASGQLIARWNAKGLVSVDPTNTSHALRLLNDVLSYTQAYAGGAESESVWVPAINSSGAIATAITQGFFPGSHNSIPNSGFELSAFAQDFTVTWDVSPGAPGWDDAELSMGMNTADANNLTLISGTY